jgi:DeoR family deoxyribose operon repressor
MNSQAKRLNKILEHLRKNTASSVKRLSEELSVSHMTIRRDLELLEKQNIVETFHGGVMLRFPGLAGKNSDYSLLQAATSMAEEKIGIGEAAAKLLKSEDIIVIDSGSTTEYLARALPRALPLTVICYALNILMDVTKRENCDIIFAGGQYHTNTLMFESPEGIQLIKRTRASKAFVSASGISDRLGVTCSNRYEGSTKQAIMETSMQKILLADSTNFDRVRSTCFADLKDFDILITDEGIPLEYREYCGKEGIELIVV